MRDNFDFHFFLTSDTQLSLLKVLHNFKTFCMQEKIRSYLSSLHNAAQSHDPYHMDSYIVTQPVTRLCSGIILHSLT